MVRCGSCKRSTARTIIGEQEPDFIISESSLIVDQNTSTKTWAREAVEIMYGDDNKGKDDFSLGEILSC